MKSGLKNTMEKVKWATINHPINQSASKEDDAMYLVGLEEHCVLGALSEKSDIEIVQLLFPIGLFKGSNWWKMWN